MELSSNLERKIDNLNFKEALLTLVPISGDKKLHSMFQTDRQFHDETIGKKSKTYNAMTYFAEVSIFLGKYSPIISGIGYFLTK